VDVFKDDGYKPLSKPTSILHAPVYDGIVNRNRQWYDEYLLYIDSEFGRLYQNLEKSGVLDNTCLVLTSDHGELFERGIIAHNTVTLYDPVIHIPLLIFPPGNTEHQDIYARTSAIDVLPTLLEISNKNIPDWLEGEVLPPFSATPRHSPVFTLDSKKTKPQSPITEASVAMFSGKLKATKYFGYDKLEEQGPLVEIYDLEKDPDELNDLSATNSQIAQDLLSQIDTKLEEVNAPFE
jgi:arylsulfatase A-like enzyme